ncbi:MAG: hypothetical protein AMXMBFR53_05170 [Gemmatimonadota bacterium]
MRRLTIALVAAAYRLALLRYPRSLRLRHGRQMAEDARALMEEAARGQGLRGVVRAAARLARDLARPVPRVRQAGAPRRASSGGPGMGFALATAGRSLRRDPRFTVAVVGVVGTALALNALVLAAVNAYLVRPLPYPEADRLFDVRPVTDVGWREVGDVFEKAVSWDLDAFTVVGEGAPDLAWGAWVTPDFFELYGLRPVLGRTLLPEEAGDGAAAVAVISHRLWRDRFGGDPSILGRTFRAFTSDRPDDAETFTVVGVLGPDAWHFNRFTDVLVPLRADQPVYAGRLRRDVPRERAEELLTSLARARAGDAPAQDLRVGLRGVQDAYTARVRPRLLVTLSAAFLVLLIACANAGVLTLVRSAGRARELAVRRALGAGGAGLAAPLLAEGLLLALGAAALALGAALALLPVLAAAVQARVGAPLPGGPGALRLDATVALVLLGTSVVVGLALGLVPLHAAARATPGASLAAGGRGVTDAGTRRLRGLLVGGELALSLALLTGAGLLVRSALHLEGLELGFDPAGMEVANVGLRQARYPDDASRVAFYDALVEEVSRVPGVAGATVVRAAPFVSNATLRPVEGEGGALPHEGALPQVVHPSFFGVLDVPVLRGRAFTPEDGSGSVAVAVITEELARHLWPGEDPLGRRLRFVEVPNATSGGGPGAWRTVVGVVPEMVTSLGEETPVVFEPHAQSAGLWMSLAYRVRPGAPPPRDGVTAALRALDAEAPLYGRVSLEDAASAALAPSRFFAALLGAFAAFAFLLALVGLYAVVAYAVRQQRKEVAIRMALGARGGAVQRLFLRRALATVAASVALGAAGGRVLGGALQDQLHGVEPGDPLVVLGGAVLLAATALLAVWLPAREASRADPMGVLREE